MNDPGSGTTTLPGAGFSVRYPHVLFYISSIASATVECLFLLSGVDIVTEPKLKLGGLALVGLDLPLLVMVVALVVVAPVVAPGVVEEDTTEHNK